MPKKMKKGKIGEPIGRVFLGIDPGKTGGLATVTQAGTLLWWSVMPQTELDLWKELERMKGVHSAVLEKVHAMPKQSPNSMFTFGEGYGKLIMGLTAAKIPFNLISPQHWQKELKVPPRKKTESKPQHKERLRRRAQQLFPRDSLWEAGLGVQRSVCDAILIAYYATGKSIDE